MAYIDYIMKTTQELLSIDSPTGFTHMATAFVRDEFTKMGYSPVVTRKGAVLVDLGGKDTENAILLAAHMDTLGAMVTDVKGNGRLKVTNIGGLSPNNTETETCRVYTRAGQVYEGTLQLANASTHVNLEYNGTKRTWDTVEVVLDEMVKSKADTEALGIMRGDFVCLNPRTTVTEKGFIKSRFLDDKFSSAILMGYAKYLKDENITPDRQIYLFFTTYEEVGHGGAASIPQNISEMISVDMGCVGDTLGCDETMVSICAKDSMGPYDYTVTSALVKCAQEKNLGYAVDIYPGYGSDVDVTLKAGHDIRHGLIGPGVYASHGYERSHIKGAENTFELIRAYLG